MTYGQVIPSAKHQKYQVLPTFGVMVNIGRTFFRLSVSQITYFIRLYI